MARIRSVHPQHFTDEAIVSCSPLARLLFIGLWTEADDRGVFEWRPLQIKMRLLPGDVADTKVLLDELVNAGLLRTFAEGGQNYGVIKDFQKWQRPQKPRAQYPLPDEMVGFITGQEAAPPDLFSGNGTGESNQMERRGEEGERKGRGRRAGAPETPIPEGFPDQEAIDWATEQFVDAGVVIGAAREAIRFRDHNLSKGKLFKDWSAAWRTWVRNAIDWSKERPGAATVHELVPVDQQRRWLREFMESPHKWRSERGPRPDDAGCRISAAVMAELGYAPPRRAQS